MSRPIDRGEQGDRLIDRHLVMWGLDEADGAIVEKGRFLALLSDLATRVQRLGLGDESIEAISSVALSDSPHRPLEVLADAARVAART